MGTHRGIVLGLVAIAAAPAIAQEQVTVTVATAAQRSGQNDFDWEFGTWRTKVRVLRNPMSGVAPDWAEYLGTSVVRPLLDGRSNLVELSVEGPAGKIEGVALRLYNPQARQWAIHYASLRGGTLTPPVFGAFDGAGRGVFYGQDSVDGRAVMVRFAITQVSRNEARFEQAFSADGGATWETNWIAVDTRR